MRNVLLTCKRSFTSAQTPLADGSSTARSRPLPQRYVTMPVRSVRYRARRGVIRMFNYRGQTMKRLLLAGAALSVATAATAADIPARPYAKGPAAVMSPAYNWSGFYVGAMGGFGSGTNVGSGGFGGGTVGYNWQLPGSQFVFGVEVDAAGASIKDSFTEEVDVGVLTPATL